VLAAVKDKASVALTPSLAAAERDGADDLQSRGEGTALRPNKGTVAGNAWSSLALAERP